MVLFLLILLNVSQSISAQPKYITPTLMQFRKGLDFLQHIQVKFYPKILTAVYNSFISYKCLFFVFGKAEKFLFSCFNYAAPTLHHGEKEKNIYSTWLLHDVKILVTHSKVNCYTVRCGQTFHISALISHSHCRHDIEDLLEQIKELQINAQRCFGI